MGALHSNVCVWCKMTWAECLTVKFVEKANSGWGMCSMAAVLSRNAMHTICTNAHASNAFEGNSI